MSWLTVQLQLHRTVLMENQAVVVVDATGTILLWSAGAERLFGFTSQQALGQPLDLIIPPDYRAQHQSCFAAAMATGAAKLENQPFDLPVLARGQVVAVRGVLTLVRDPDKNVIGAMAVLTLPAASAA
jgi:PAS domain S-box-containing protein